MASCSLRIRGHVAVGVREVGEERAGELQLAHHNLQHGFQHLVSAMVEWMRRPPPAVPACAPPAACKERFIPLISASKRSIPVGSIPATGVP